MRLVAVEPPRKLPVKAHLSWPVPIEGFEIVTEDNGQRSLSPRGHGFIDVDPMASEHRTAWLEFARLAMDDQQSGYASGVISFANRYGMLTRRANPWPDEIDAARPTESLALWQEAVRFFAWPTLRGKKVGPGVVAQLNENGLRGRVSPVVWPLSPGSQRRIELVPHDLLGALCLQLAESLTTAKRAGTCDMCGEPLKDKRSDARFCSPSCRKLYWWHHRQAPPHEDPLPAEQAHLPIAPHQLPAARLTLDTANEGKGAR